MTDSWTDPASLQGDALTQWYLRSPADVERERQEAAARRHQDFFYGGAGNDTDPGFGREVPASSQDIDPGFAMPAPASSEDIDPGFTWVPAGPNRWRSVKVEDLQPPSPTTLAPYDMTAPSGDGMGGFADDEDSAAPAVTPSGLDLTPQFLARPDEDLRGPPALTYGQLTPAGPAGPNMRVPGLPGQSSLTPMRTPLAGGPTAPPSKAGGVITYGALRAPAPSDQELAELRRQQAAFANTTRQIDIHNSWFAVPALAPAVVALGLGAAGEWATGEVAPAAGRAVANFVERDPYLRVGDNWATRAGRRAHAWLEQRAAAKPGWDYEPDVPRPGARPLKPDLGTPPRGPADVAKRYYLELKPNTPTGRAAAARAVKKYLDATQRPVRPIYYDPKDFI